MLQLHCGTLAMNFSQLSGTMEKNSLMMASKKGHVRVVAELLQHGAKVDMHMIFLLFMCGFVAIVCVGLSN